MKYHKSQVIINNVKIRLNYFQLIYRILHNLFIFINNLSINDSKTGLFDHLIDHHEKSKSKNDSKTDSKTAPIRGSLRAHNFLERVNYDDEFFSILKIKSIMI